MRMGMRCFTRLTNGFSKKRGEPGPCRVAALPLLQLRPSALALKGPYPRTHAMAAGVADHVWTLEEIAALLN
jgi:hypothetical protein